MAHSEDGFGLRIVSVQNQPEVQGGSKNRDKFDLYTFHAYFFVHAGNF